MRQLKKGEIEQKEWEDTLEPHQRDSTKESQILMWIWNCLEVVTTLDYEQFLKDGVALCKLMNHIKPGSITDEILPGGNFRERRRNIELFLRAIEKYGVPKHLLFKNEDLHLLQHLPRVTRCIFALGRLVDEDEDYTGPKLGDEPYDPVNRAAGRRRGGMPLGDDIYVAHVNVRNVIQRLPSLVEGEQPITIG
ncbi:myophilin-like [Ornithodoros turicata]|uniref:myophilin-like n=1 Tax=Ornithodoros turicata TaxID=34597 RepID=UPI003138D3B6